VFDRGTATSFNANIQIMFNEGYPAVINDSAASVEVVERGAWR
jgi:hypothetical protein